MILKVRALQEKYVNSRTKKDAYIFSDNMLIVKIT